MEVKNDTTTGVDEVKPRTFRLAESVVNDFTDKRNAVDLSANDFMKKMLAMIDLGAAAEMLPERKAEIAQVEFYFREFMSSYVQSLLLYHRADDIAREKNKQEIEEKKNLIRTLQATIINNNETISALEQEVRRLTMECDRTKKELATAQSNSKTSEDVSVKLSELQKQVEVLTLAATEKHGRKPRNAGAKAKPTTKEGE